MRLFAAIVPPPSALSEVMRLVQSVGVPVAEAPAPRRWTLPRPGRAEAARRAVPAPVEDQLELPPPDTRIISIASFGNVTHGDSVTLANAMRSEARTWRRPTLRFAGGAALEFPGDESVWAKVEGEVDDLMRIAKGIPQLVQRLGFFVDRRQFRPWLSVGTITEATTAPYLERLVEALDGFHGEPWTVTTLSLMRWVPEEGQDSIETVERMPLQRR